MLTFWDHMVLRSSLRSFQIPHQVKTDYIISTASTTAPCIQPACSNRISTFVSKYPRQCPPLSPTPTTSSFHTFLVLPAVSMTSYRQALCLKCACHFSAKRKRSWLYAINIPKDVCDGELQRERPSKLVSVLRVEN